MFLKIFIKNQPKKPPQKINTKPLYSNEIPVFIFEMLNDQEYISFFLVIFSSIKLGNNNVSTYQCRFLQWVFQAITAA